MNRRKILFWRAALLTALSSLACGLLSFSGQSHLAAFSRPGDLDPTFGTGGKVITPISLINNDDYGRAAVLQNDGKLLIAGSSSNQADGGFALARYHTDGTPDASFGTQGKVFTPLGNSSGINGIALQSDGKILAAGYSWAEQFTVARYNADGSLDTSFGTGGMVHTFIAQNNVARALAVQSDGKIVVAGHGLIGSGANVTYTFVLARYHSSGSLDASFGTGGKVRAPIGTWHAFARAVEIQNDGKIVAAGQTEVGLDGALALARYNPDGSFDTSFGTGGKAFTTRLAAGNGLALQSDGRIVAAGPPSFSLARYNADGTLDTGFGSGGSVTTEFGSPYSSASDVALQSDGKIVAAGHINLSVMPNYTNLISDFAMARYNADGNLDMSFGDRGKVVTPIGRGNDQASTVVIQTDGKILAAGQSRDVKDADFAAARYDASGRLDNGYGTGGVVLMQVGPHYHGDDNAQATVLQSDGKILVAGHTNPYPAFALARYHDNGMLDASFGSGGHVITQFGAGASSANAVAVQSDSKIILAGSHLNYPTHNDFALVRYNPDGSLDTTFGTGGHVLTTFSSGPDIARALVVQSDGKIIAVGESLEVGFALARYHTDGSLDTGFGDGGKVVTSFGGVAYAYAAAIQSDGRIIAAGYGRSQNNAAFSCALARYHVNGTLDMSFGSSGKVLSDLNSINFGYAMALQADGKIVVAGSRGFGDYTSFALERFNPDGSPDSSFGIDGSVITPVVNVSGAYAVAIQSDGKIVAAGASGVSPFSRFTVVRYSVSGVLDEGFGAHGIVRSLIGGRTDVATSIVIQNDGKIFAAGRSDSWSDIDFAIARYWGGTSSTPVSRKAFDFDGDGKADLGVFRPAEAVWYLLPSSQQSLSAQRWGIATDKLVPADYDGDGKADIAVFRDGMWYRVNSSNNAFVAQSFGQAGDVPAPGDYDGDHKADVAVYRSGVWYIQQSAAGFKAVQFGLSADKLVAADYDGDGLMDPAVFRNGIWYSLQSTAGFKQVQFGIATDKPVVSDYDGDGKADAAVYRGGTWYVLQSSSQNPLIVPFGSDTGLPVPADYDGDGRADMATYRDGAWYLRRSINLTFASQHFGASGDVAIESAYLPQ